MNGQAINSASLSEARPKRTSNRRARPSKLSGGLDECHRIYIHQTIKEFLVSTDESFSYPATLTKSQRAYIHQYIRKVGLVSRSYGKNEKRFITVSKPAKPTTVSENFESIFTGEALTMAFDYLERPGVESSLGKRRTDVRLPSHSNGAYSRPVTLGKKFIPPCGAAPAWIRRERENLPVYRMRDEILRIINTHQVVLLDGETGSGKSTQVPQYILENAYQNGQPCRMICTQPRRIAAVSIAERVSFERSEKTGTTVGYQIRFENNVQTHTNLIYVTSGCFLRSLTNAANQTFQGITHIIIDEIHERDKNTDFVLIALREELAVNPRLKVILMSATMNTKLLCNYFRGCQVVRIPGHCYETRVFFLEDILFYIKYETAEMRAILQRLRQESSKTSRKRANPAEIPAVELDEDTRDFVDSLLTRCRDEPESMVAEYFEQLIYLIEGEGIPVNIQHRETGSTALMVAAMRNNLKYLHRFLKKGANTQLRDASGNTAMNYASMHADNQYCVDCLNQDMDLDSEHEENERKHLLYAYHQQFPDELDEVDHDLLLTLLLTINNADYQGSILVFLPGYNDMMVQKEMIEREFKHGTYNLFLIHGSMSVNKQRAAFKRSKVRKIILATNIAETSITFPDVAYVVDTGRVKQNVYFSTTGLSYLQSVDISKACARQRAGRAGRTQTGICYRLYSSAKFESMSEFAVAELLRVPLTEICLYTKVITKESIANYLEKAIEPPSRINVTNAIKKLMTIGALNQNEDLTILGKRLVEIPLDVQLGKCLLYAILFRCLSPVLTIVAYFSAKDPFLLPTDRADRGRVSSLRKELGDNVSDHLGIIRLYQKWHKSRQLRTESRFLADHNLSKASLEMMSAAQSQILDYVRRTTLPSGVPISVLNENAKDWNVIRACLTAGLYPNVARVDRTTNKIKTLFEKSIVFHQSSVLAGSSNKGESKSLNHLPTNWIIFNESMRMGARAFIRYNTLVTPLNVALFCGGLETRSEGMADEIDVACKEESNEAGDCAATIPNDCSSFAIDDWIHFDVAALERLALLQMKEHLLNTFVQFLHSGRQWHPEQYSNLIGTLKRILFCDCSEQFGNVAEPFDESYLPKRYDTLTNIKHFQPDYR